MIELVLVLVIVGTLSAYALPRFFNPTAFNERFYYDSVKSLLHSAQKLSVANGCHTLVSVTANNVSAWRRASCTDGSFNIAVQSLDISSDIAVTANDFPIYFDSLGRATNASTGFIDDSSIDLNSRTIRIIGFTGLVYDD